MAKEKKKKGAKQESNHEEVLIVKKVTRYMRNITPMKIEVPFGDSIVSIKPNETVQVPENFILPHGIGLVER